ncbi:MAG TPA: signal recognition particle subunit SRP19/SEC65 family protein [Sulfolobales archaeon]|nr:signal recognition particle subunit SRP19/SEC65 family protein [Sulfolobales archaeon]
MVKRIIVWLSYLDPSLPRRLGRRIARDRLPGRITLNDLLEACKSLGLKCEVLEDKRYPRTWYMGHRAVVIEYEGKKSQLLREIARVLLSRVS